MNLNNLKIRLYEGLNELKRDSFNLQFFADFPSYLDHTPPGDYIDMGYPVKNGKITKDEAVDRIQKILESGTALTLIQQQYIHESFYAFAYQNRTNGWGNIINRTLEKLRWLFMEFPFYCANCKTEFIPKNTRNDLCPECQKDRVRIHGMLNYKKGKLK